MTKFISRQRTDQTGFFVLNLGVELFGAMGDPEEVIELLWVARIGVIGTFVLVLDLDARGLRCRPLFSCCAGGGAVDGASGGFWKGGGCEG
jgi:hypothetical protein